MFVLLRGQLREFLVSADVATVGSTEVETVAHWVNNFLPEWDRVSLFSV